MFGVRPAISTQDRLPADLRNRLHQLLHDAGRPTADTTVSTEKLIMLRGLYEPFLEALSRHFMLTLPPIFSPERSADNWQRSAWMPKTPGIGELPAALTDGTHFD
jgi:hypothetical protein